MFFSTALDDEELIQLAAGYLPEAVDATEASCSFDNNDCLWSTVDDETLSQDWIRQQGATPYVNLGKSLSSTVG